MAAKINPNQKIPQHVRITEDMRDLIRTGFWAAGTMIPGRRELALSHNVSVATIERAMVPLLSDGTLTVASNRRGTFVGLRIDGSCSLQSGTTNPVHETAVGPGLPHSTRHIWHNNSRPADISRSNGVIGVVATLFDQMHSRGMQNDYWVRQMLDAMERTFSMSGQATTFHNRVTEYGQWPAPLYESLISALQQPIAGLIVIGLDLSTKAYVEALTAIEAFSGPVVCVAASELPRPVPQVMFDNWRAGYLAGQHLLRSGYRNLSMIVPYQAEWAEERLVGVRSAMEHSGVSPDALVVLRGDNLPHNYLAHEKEPIQRALQLGMDAGWRPTGGIVCANDNIAFSLMNAATEYGWDLTGAGLVGFDDHPSARHYGLTSIQPPIAAIGEEAARLVLELLAGQQKASIIRMPPSLIVRCTMQPSIN